MERTEKKTEEPSYPELVKQISEIYASATYTGLQDRYNRVSLLEIIKRERRETVHSSFLAWFFGQNFSSPNNPNPVLMFIRLLALNSIEQQGLILGNSQKEFLHEIITNNVIILHSDVSVEDFTSSSKGNGRADIIILSKFKKKKENDVKTLRIIIENKIDHKEIDAQCQKYYEHFSKMNDVNLTLYAFLSVDDNPNVSCDKFIGVSYQNLLDKVLEPMLKFSQQHSINFHTYLQEYINAITTLRTPSNKKQIAMSSDVKKLLTDFYQNNKEIILAAINEAAPDEIKEKVKEARNYSSYTLTYTDAFGKVITVPIEYKSQLAKTFVEIYCSLHPTVNFKEIQNLFKSVKRDLIFDEPKERSQKIDGKDWWILTGIWGEGSKYFDNLRKLITENGIKVEEIE